MDPSVDYAEYLRQKYQLGEMAQEEGYERPSTADFSEFTKESELYVERRPAQRPRTSSSSNLSNAERLSRNKAAKKAVTDVTTYNHISNLYHLNRRIQEMHTKSGRKGYSTPGRVGTVDAAELGSVGDRPAWDSRPGTGSSACSGSRPGTASTPRIAGAPNSPPSPHRPMSAPSPFRQNPLFPPAGGGGGVTQRQQQQRQLQRPATSLESWGFDGDGSGRSSSLAEPPVAPVASFTERRIKNTAQSLKTAILNEIIENRIYEEKRLKQLFRSYMKLNSGEAFYPTLCSVIEDLRQELDIK